MRRTLLALLLLTPVAAMADDAQCAFRADRQLDLDLTGVRHVLLKTNAFDINVEGASGGKGTAHGRACASSQALLDALTIAQSRQGDTLTVELSPDNHTWSFGHSYTDFRVDVSLPANLPVTVEVGSGDAKVHGVASLEASVGSGDLDASDIRGDVAVTGGSGDMKIARVGKLSVKSLGSGDLTVREAASVGIGSVGSGDAKLNDIRGDVEVRSVGSGDVEVDNVRGNLTVHSRGSGDVNYHGVGGKVDVPRDDDR